MASPSQSARFILPDLVSHCDFTLRISRHRKQVTAETKKWLFKGDNLVGEKRQAYHGLNAGLLTAMCYPDAACPQLRLCNDFLTFLFHLDNLSDDMDNRGTRYVADVVLNSLYHPYTYNSSVRIGRMTRDLYKRMLPTAAPGTQQRFIETMDFFFQSVTQQALDRATGVIPDLESYIALRRDTSGCKPCWALIEYAGNLKIPDEVMDHPTIRNLGEATNDLVTWSNDVFSYNVEQSKGDTHNMIPVVMNQMGFDLQSAVDFVGDMCKKSIDRFKAERAKLPSWGPEIDRQVAIYVDGLANWIVGSLHWSFESTRYFGTNGRRIKATRIVELLPLRPGYRRPSIGAERKIISQVPKPQVEQLQEPTPSADGPVSSVARSDECDVSTAASNDPSTPPEPSPTKHATTPILDRIQTGPFQVPVSMAANGPISCPLSPEVDVLPTPHVIKDNPFADSFSFYSLTAWVFYSLIYQPALWVLRFLLNRDVHSRPFIHYEYM